MIGPQTVLNGRYQLDKQIGEGGFARVFLATDLQLMRQVAVKVLSSNMAESEEFLGRFKQEARSIASFEHPNILSVYDYGEFEGSPYLVMPYVDGGTLHDRLKSGPVTPEEAGKYLEQMGEALDYAHNRNTVHRDVKPQNMLMRRDGRLMLTDFGIAKLLTNDSTTNNQTRSMGTVSYMAPEQGDGHVNPQSDIYALGVVLFQMLTGQLPFTGSTSQVLTSHYTKPVPSLVGHPALQNVSPSVLRKIDEVISKAMAKNANDRFRSGGEMAKAFKAALATPATEDATIMARPGADVSAATIVAQPQNFNQPQGYNQPPSHSQPQIYPQGYTPSGYNYQQPGTQPNFVPYAPTTQPGFPNQGQYSTPQTQANFPPQNTPPYGPQYPNMPQQPQPPKKSNTGLIVGVVGGLVAIVVLGVVLIGVLGGSKPATNTTPTVQAAATSTTAPAGTTTTAASTTKAASTTAPVTTAAASTTAASATTAAPATTAGGLFNGNATTAAATTAVPVTTAAPATTAKPATTTAPATTTKPAATTTTPSAPATIKAPSGYDVFKNTDKNQLNLEIAYPKGWTTKMDDDNLGVTITNGDASFIILREEKGTTSGTIDELNARFIEDLKKEGWKPYADASRFFGIGGEKWVQSSYAKGDFRAWGLFALHRGIPYALVLTGSNTNFDKVLGNEFSEMFNDLHFLDSFISDFANELKSYKDPSGRFVVNYPDEKWKLDKDTVIKKDNTNALFYMADATNSSLSTEDLLVVYKDKLANSGDYENFQETKTYAVSNIDSNTQEQVLAYTFTYKGKNLQGEIYVRKQGTKVYVGVSEADNQDDLDLIYGRIWRYTEFIK